MLFYRKQTWQSSQM